MNAGGGVHRPCLSRITTFAPSLHGGAFLLWLSRAPRLARHLDDLARCGALEEDEHAVGGSQLPLLANTLLLPRRETGGVFRKMLGD